MRFREMLKKRAVPSELHQYYYKWLRYYLDYCAKYHLPEKSSRSLTQFLLKLKEKKQTEEQQKQAGHAVSLYLDMEKANAKVPSVGDVSASVQPPPLNPLSPGKAFKGPQQTANDERKPSPAPEQEMRQPLTFKEYWATGAAKTQWVKAIAEMTAVIKTKHYSAKTLKSYGLWVWKFQRFKKDTDPVSLRRQGFPVLACSFLQSFGLFSESGFQRCSVFLPQCPEERLRRNS